MIEVQYTKLLEAMGEAKDLKAAESAHEGFLAACIVQSCLDVPMFSTLLSKVLTTCKAFCASMQVSPTSKSWHLLKPVAGCRRDSLYLSAFGPRGSICLRFRTQASNARPTVKSTDLNARALIHCLAFDISKLFSDLELLGTHSLYSRDLKMLRQIALPAGGGSQQVCRIPVPQTAGRGVPPPLTPALQAPVHHLHAKPCQSALPQAALAAPEL